MNSEGITTQSLSITEDEMRLLDGALKVLSSFMVGMIREGHSDTNSALEFKVRIPEDMHMELSVFEIRIMPVLTESAYAAAADKRKSLN